MHHVLVDLRYEKAYIFNNLIKCIFVISLFDAPYLGCPGPLPRLPPLHATAYSPISCSFKCALIEDKAGFCSLCIMELSIYIVLSLDL